MEKLNEKESPNVENVISRSQLIVEKYQKTIIVAVVAVVILILAFFGLKRFYFQPRQERANAALFAAEQWFSQNNFQEALDGNDQFSGFIEVADRYGSTKAGRRAKYCAGLCYLHLGQFDEATRYLKSYSGKDMLTPVLAKIAEGDAELDGGNNTQALKCYEQAAKMSDNDITTPFALFKAGWVYLLNNNGSRAAECFQKVKENYPYSTEYRDIDKYIALAENL